jgi:hypothetical protein
MPPIDEATPTVLRIAEVEDKGKSAKKVQNNLQR